MRITGGHLKGREVKNYHKLKDTRPIQNKVRQSLFDIIGPSILDAVMIDAFAGTGIVGIEALSRGAREVTFIDKSAKCIASIKKNLGNISLLESAELHCQDVAIALAGIAMQEVCADLMFCGAPYFFTEWQRIFELIPHSGLLKKEKSFIMEISCRENDPPSLGENRRREYVYGETKLLILDWT